MKRSKDICIALATAFAVLMSVMLVNGCGTSLKFPSVTETRTLTYNPGQVVWRDLVTADPKKASEFYKKVFGWTVDKAGTEDTPYWIFRNNGKRIAGMFEMTDAKKNAGGEWIGYVSVPSVENASKKTLTAGGTVLREPVEMEGRGMAALLSDPQRAIFAVIKSADGDPQTNKETVANEWLWSELWANNPETAGDFYKDLLTAEIEKKEVDDISYRLINKSGRRCSGIIQSPAKETRSHWLQYIKVSDVAGTIKRAVDAGATVLIEPNEKIRKGNVAVLMDPTGAPFAIQLWPYQ
jgi:hypothetical protein